MASLNEAKIVISADDRTSAAFKSAERSIGSLKSAAAGLGVALSVGAFTGFIKSSIDMADSLNDLSKTTGASVETLAGLQIAAKQSGTELETVARGMLKFSSVVLDASNGSKEAADKIAALGLNLNTLKLQSPEQQFIALAGALEKFGADKQGVIVADVLGQKMATLTPLLSEGAKGLGEMLDQGKKLNPITAEMAKQADAFNDSLVVLKAQSSSFGITIANGILPGLNRIIEQFNEGVRIAGSFSDALLLFGTMNPFKSVAGSVTDLRAEIKGLEEDRARFVKFNSDTSSIDTALAGLKKKYEFAKLLQRQEALASSAGTPMGNEGRSARVSSVAEYTKPDTAAAEKHTKEIMALAEKQRKAMQDSNQWAADSLSGQIADANAEQRKWTEEAQATARAFVDMVSPADEIVRKIQSVEHLMESGFLSQDQGVAVLFDLNDQLDQLNKVKDAGKDTYAELTRAVEGWGNAFTDTMADMVMTGKLSFGDMANSIIRDLLRMSIQANVTKPLFDSFQSGISGSSGSGDSSGWISTIASFFTASAKGNVFSGPGISAYSGQIVSSPTLFPFAKGIGLMGEAGNEAIMPLKRNASGSLGVSAEGMVGGNVVVNIIENPDKGGQTQTRNEGGKQMVDVFVSQIVSQINRDTSRGAGLAPMLEGRYRLNPAAGAVR